MNELSKTIFDAYHIRKGAKRKARFREFIVNAMREQGYPVEVEHTKGRASNIVIGKPDTAKVVITAHYDTCAVMLIPNFITPQKIWLYALYQIVIVAAIFAVGYFAMALPVLLGWTDELIPPIFSAVLLLIAGLMMFGPANRHTANDNTSGVIALVETALALPEELRAKAAFVLFDNEETGLIGSGEFAKRHRTLRNGTPVINLDCVSEGSIYFSCSPSSRTRRLRPRLQRRSFHATARPLR